MNKDQRSCRCHHYYHRKKSADYCQTHGTEDRRSHFHKSYEAGSDWRDIPEEVAYEVYRILQELFSNIVRHAEATRTDIELRLTPSVLSLLINDDDTTSFASSSGTPGHGIGLNTVRERVKALKGTLRISTSESGQSFLLEVPLCGENKGKKG